MILSKDIIEERQYHESITFIYWYNSDIRRYLNGDYLDTFSASHRKLISKTRVINENNQWYGTSGGYITIDKIFLLSISEVVRYFGDSGQLARKPNINESRINDQYNSKRIAHFNGQASYWWLRSPGFHNVSASAVYDDGDIDVYGRYAQFFKEGVRPALWLNLGY